MASCASLLTSDWRSDFSWSPWLDLVFGVALLLFLKLARRLNPISEDYEASSLRFFTLRALSIPLNILLNQKMLRRSNARGPKTQKKYRTFGMLRNFLINESEITFLISESYFITVFKLETSVFVVFHKLLWFCKSLSFRYEPCNFFAENPKKLK